MKNVIKIKNEIQEIENRLNNMFFGSIEIRETNEKKYIYVHNKINGIQKTKYVGEYSVELHNLLLNNNLVAKELKRKLKELRKEFELISVEIKKEILDDVNLNIDFAKRNLVDLIYKQSMLEGVATNYSDIETLINGGKVKDMNALDVLKVINLKHAWEFVLDIDVIGLPTDFSLLSQINYFVQEGISYTAGKLRNVEVTIGGSNYIPPFPFESKIKEDIICILNNTRINDVEKTIELISYVMKKQAFLDGNKRTAVIFGNHYLISKGKGLMVIPVENLEEYKKLLIDYYESKNEKIKEFLKNKCYIELIKKY